MLSNSRHGDTDLKLHVAPYPVAKRHFPPCLDIVMLKGKSPEEQMRSFLETDQPKRNKKLPIF